MPHSVFTVVAKVVKLHVGITDDYVSQCLIEIKIGSVRNSTRGIIHLDDLR